MAEEVELLGQGQSFVVLAAELQGGQDGQGQDGTGGYLSLRVIFVPNSLKGIGKIALRADL